MDSRKINLIRRERNSRVNDSVDTEGDRHAAEDHAPVWFAHCSVTSPCCWDHQSAAPAPRHAAGPAASAAQQPAPADAPAPDAPAAVSAVGGAHGADQSAAADHAVPAAGPVAARRQEVVDRLRDHHRDPGRSRRRRHAAQVRWLGLVQVRQHQGHQRGQGFRCCCPDGERSAAGRRPGSRARGGGGSASASGCGDAYRRGGDRGGSCSRRRSLCGACCCAGRGSGSAHDRGAGGEAREIREGTARSVDRHRQAEQADGRRPEGHRLHQARC